MTMNPIINSLEFGANADRFEEHARPIHTARLLSLGNDGE